MHVDLQAHGNAVLEALPTSFSQSEDEALAYCKALGIRSPQSRHIMGFGCQLGVYEALSKFWGCRLSTESRSEQWFDIDAFGDLSVVVDVKCRTAGSSTSWTISRRELEAELPGIMIYAFYVYSPVSKLFTFHGTMARYQDQDLRFKPPRPSKFNDGYFWFAGTVPSGNTWRFS